MSTEISANSTKNISALARWSRLLLVVVALPALIAPLDRWAFREADRLFWAPDISLWLYGLFVAQTAVVSWAAGRFLDHWGWRLLVLTWVLVMVNQLLPISQSTIWGATAPLLVYGFLAAEFGALALWGVLGNWNWPLRIPAVVFAAIPLVRLIPPAEYRARAWVSLLLVQTGSLAVLLVALWLRGYRVRSAAEIVAGAGSGRVLQFSIAHMLIWTTASAVLFTLLRVFQPLLGTYGAQRWLHTGALGVCCALVTLAAIWAILGDGRAYSRLLVLVTWPPLCGAGIWWLADTLERTQAGSFLVHYIGGLGALWMAWTSLSAAFLASLLLVLRTTGYRLVHVAKGQALSWNARLTSPTA